MDALFGKEARDESNSVTKEEDELHFADFFFDSTAVAAATSRPPTGTAISPALPATAAVADASAGEEGAS